MIRAVIFDLDDTLYAENDYVMSGFRAAAAYLHRPELTKKFAEKYSAGSKAVFDAVCLSEKLETDAKQLADIYRHHTPDIKLFSDVLPVFAELAKKEIRLGLITDGRPFQQQKKIDALGIEKYFDPIILTDTLGIEHRKPDTYAFELVKDKWKIPFSDIMYVGDNPRKDFYIGSRGVCTVRILRENALYRDETYFENIAPRYIISSLKEITEILS